MNDETILLLNSGVLDTRYLVQSQNLADLDSPATARTNLGLVAGGAGDIWVEKAGDTMTGALTNTLATGNSLVWDTNTLIVDATNHRVGIGTTSPQGKLQVQNNGAVDIITKSAADWASIYTNTDTVITWGASGSSRNLIFQTATSFPYTTLSEKMRITSGGNVGIGTTAPSYGKLQIASTKGSSDTGLTILAPDGITSRFWSGTNDELHITRGATATNGITILTTGYVGIGSIDPISPLQVSFDSNTVYPGYAVAQAQLAVHNSSLVDNVTAGVSLRGVDSNNVARSAAQLVGIISNRTVSGLDGTLAIITNNAGTLSEKMRITNAGNVGIGTTSPTSKLHVVGGLNLNITTVTDTYTVLTTDYTVICNKATAFTVTLPVAVVGQTYNIKNIGAGTVTVDGTSTDTIDDVTSQDVEQWENLTVQCYIANKWIIL